MTLPAADLYGGGRGVFVCAGYGRGVCVMNVSCAYYYYFPSIVKRIRRNRKVQTLTHKLNSPNMC